MQFRIIFHGRRRGNLLSIFLRLTVPPSCSVSRDGGTDQPFSYSFLTLVGRAYIGQLKIPHIRPEVVFKPIMHRESKMVLHRPRQGLVIQVALPPRLLFCSQAGTMTASSHGVRLTRSAFIKAIWHSSLGQFPRISQPKKDFNLPGLEHTALSAY